MTNKFSKCPKCSKSTDLQETKLLVDDEKITQFVKCHECGQQFKVIYKADEVTEL